MKHEYEYEILSYVWVIQWWSMNTSMRCYRMCGWCKDEAWIQVWDTIVCVGDTMMKHEYEYEMLSCVWVMQRWSMNTSMRYYRMCGWCNDEAWIRVWDTIVCVGDAMMKHEYEYEMLSYVWVMQWWSMNTSMSYYRMCGWCDDEAWILVWDAIVCVGDAMMKHEYEYEGTIVCVGDAMMKHEYKYEILSYVWVIQWWSMNTSMRYYRMCGWYNDEAWIRVWDTIVCVGDAMMKHEYEYEILSYVWEMQWWSMNTSMRYYRMFGWCNDEAWIRVWDAIVCEGDAMMKHEYEYEILSYVWVIQWWSMNTSMRYYHMCGWCNDEAWIRVWDTVVCVGDAMMKHEYEYEILSYVWVMQLWSMNTSMRCYRMCGWCNDEAWIRVWDTIVCVGDAMMKHEYEYEMLSYVWVMYEMLSYVWVMQWWSMNTSMRYYRMCGWCNDEAWIQVWDTIVCVGDAMMKHEYENEILSYVWVMQWWSMNTSMRYYRMCGRCNDEAWIRVLGTIVCVGDAMMKHEYEFEVWEWKVDESDVADEEYGDVEWVLSIRLEKRSFGCNFSTMMVTCCK